MLPDSATEENEFFEENSIVSVLDYGADSSGDKNSTTAFQQAIDSTGSSGGIVFIPKGTYVIEQIQLPSYIKLVGSGKGTVLRMVNNNDKPLIVLKSSVSQMVQLKDFVIDGNRENQTSPHTKGIELINTFDPSKMKEASLYDEHDARHYIENIYIKETKGDGIYLEGRGESQIKGVQTLKADGIGIFSNAQDNWFTDCSAGDSGLEGIYIGEKASNSRYVNCKAWFSGRINLDRGDGFMIKSNRVSLTGSEAQDNSKHGFVFAADDIVGSGLLAEANGWQFETDKQRSDGTGFVFYGSRNVNIQGIAADRFANSATKSHQSYAVQFLRYAKDNMIQLTSSGMNKGVMPNHSPDTLSHNKLIIIGDDSTPSPNKQHNNQLEN